MESHEGASSGPLWRSLVDAERAVRARRAEVHGLGPAARTEVLSNALASESNWDRTSALVFLRSFPEDVPVLLPAILDLAISTRWAPYAREAIAAAPRGEVIHALRSEIPPRLPRSDADAYRRLAEVLVAVAAWDTLADLIRSASTRQNEDEDYLEVASDFSAVHKRATRSSEPNQREPNDEDG